MREKSLYLIIAVPVIVGLVVSLFFPMGIVSLAIVILCLSITLFFIFKTRGRKDVAKI